MILNALTFLSGIFLSGTAAYYSIVGLIAIFPSVPASIIAMGSALEVSKLVAASWLYRNWSIAPYLMRFYMTLAILILMLITSMGIFGYLSKAHLDNSLLSSADTEYRIQTLDQKIETKKKRISSIDSQIDALDQTYARYVELGSLTKGLEQKSNIDKRRKEFETERETVEGDLLSLQEERNKLNINVKKLEAEVGPLKYIAELVFDNPSGDNLDTAVRWVIILIVVVFDPLAVMLMIAFNVSTTAKQKKIELPKKVVYHEEPKVLDEKFDIQPITKEEILQEEPPRQQPVEPKKDVWMPSVLKEH